jgi:DNA polymerase III subunit gamma/tau
MGVCEPGQGGNAAAISNTFMCLGEPPRLSPAPGSGMATGGTVKTSHIHGEPHGTACDFLPQVSEFVTMKRAKKKVQSPEPADNPEKPDVVAPELDAVAPERVAAAPEQAVPARNASSYTVVARRYRPQRLEDLVGQDHVVRALRNAIRMNRIAQAYLFCGTRGVGKTSMARIFAKCLNCVKGPTEEPCQTCDICESIALGQDVDVIEIDGASNNGVEQVRELRQNAGLRPSRARYKIYYIDEVHMLTTGAFNALLKTLEEPPPHVKFFFATTEANKIPITVLSRCQRYDFAGITPEVIAATLSDICRQEQVEAEPEALQIVARRATGSLRDAQSLLDRLLASGSPLLTVEIVNGLLGTASDERLLAMIEAVANHDAAAALRLLEQSASEGVQPAEILSGIIDFTRDALVLAVGAESMLLSVSPRQRPHVKCIVETWTIDSILASLQILSECRARMRGSLHGRLLVELALVRIARLEDLTDLGALVERLAALESGGGPVTRKPDLTATRRNQALPEAAAFTAEQAPPSVKPPMNLPSEKVVPPSSRPDVAAIASALAPRPGDEPSRQTPSTTAALSGVIGATAVMDPPEDKAPAIAPDAGTAILTRHNESSPLDLAAIRKIWPDLFKKVGARLGVHLSQVEPVSVIGPDVLVIAANAGYNSVADECGTAESLAKIEQALQRLTHRSVTVKYERSSEVDGVGSDGRPVDVRRQEALAADPLVQRVLELFEARPHRFEYDETEPN